MADPAAPGYPKISYRAAPGPHAYQVCVQAAPGAPRVPIGEVRRYGSLPSMRGWRACGNWPGAQPTRTRQQRSDAAADLRGAWATRSAPETEEGRA